MVDILSPGMLGSPKNLRLVWFGLVWFGWAEKVLFPLDGCEILLATVQKAYDSIPQHKYQQTMVSQVVRNGLRVRPQYGSFGYGSKVVRDRRFYSLPFARATPLWQFLEPHLRNPFRTTGKPQRLLVFTGESSEARVS